MNIKSLIILAVLLLVGAGAYFYSNENSSINASDKLSTEILPGLQAALNDVAELQITGAGDQVLATISRTESGWEVKQRNGYPADISKVRAALLNLAEAKIVEEKTSNPDLYSKLGVEDISAETAQGVKVQLAYQDQTAALVVGKPGPQINKTRYVRLADSAVSWLIDRKIDLKQSPDYWLKKDILSVEPTEVAAVEIDLQDGAVLKIANRGDEEDTFEVTNLSDPNSQVVDAELHQVTNALSSFQLLDVQTSEQFAEEAPSIKVVYQLKSGVIINFTGYDKDDASYAALSASLDDASEDKDNAQKQVDEINQVASGWVYKIPNVTYDSMYKREADVLAITEDQLN